MLLMKKVFFEAIRSGEKTTTLRYWRRRMVRPGSLHTVPGLGKVHIDESRPVEFADLTNSDAKVDGFKSLRALKAALNDLYPPEYRQGRKLYMVRFKLEAAGNSGKKARTITPSLQA
jgi:hypothetical protein